MKTMAVPSMNFRQSKLKLCDILSRLEPDEYCRDEITVLIVDISYRVLPARLVDIHQAYKLYIDDLLLDLYLVSVTDGSDVQGIQHFYQFVIHPKLNEILIHNGMLCCGSIVLLKRYVMRRNRLSNRLQIYYEVCDAEVLKVNKCNRPIHWCYNLETTEMLMNKILTKRDYFQNEIPLNFWIDCIPKYPPLHARVDDPTSGSLDILRNYCERNNISRVNTLWKTDRFSAPLVVRVFAKSKSACYIPTSQHKSFPVKTTLLVYDSTGSCSVIIWDNGITKKVLDEIHEGSVIFLEEYIVRTEMNTRLWLKNIRPLPISRFPIELHIQDESRSHKFNLKLINLSLTEKFISTYLPYMQPSFVPVAEINKCQQDEILTVGGIVVGISRFYRLLRQKRVGIGKALAFRWVEIWEPSTNCRISVEVFINSQLEDHKRMKIGMVVAFTFLRVCYKKYTAQRNRIFLSTSQNTEMFLYALHDGIQRLKEDNIPSIVRQKLVDLTHQVPRDFVIPCWVGGAHPFTTNCFSSKEIQELRSSYEYGSVDGADLTRVLTNLRFWEFKTIIFNGEIVEVVWCKTGTVDQNALRQRNKSLHPRQSLCIAKSQKWDYIKRSVVVYGTKAPFCHSFPMVYDAQFPHHLHESLQFPLTNFHEIGLRNERLEMERSSVEGFQCNIVYKEYYLVTLLSKDHCAAIRCLFLPQTKTDPPTSFIEALLKENCCYVSPVDSPVISHAVPQNTDTTTYVSSAIDAIGESILSLIQIYQSGPNEYEFFFSSGIGTDQTY